MGHSREIASFFWVITSWQDFMSICDFSYICVQLLLILGWMISSVKNDRANVIFINTFSEIRRIDEASMTKPTTRWISMKVEVEYLKTLIPFFSRLLFLISLIETFTLDWILISEFYSICVCCLLFWFDLNFRRQMALKREPSLVVALIALAAQQFSSTKKNSKKILKSKYKQTKP